MTRKDRQINKLRWWLMQEQINDWGKVPKAAKEKIQETFTPIEVEEIFSLPNPRKFSFTRGKYYTITNTKQEISSAYRLRYEGKQGIHHCFREIRGGWSCTFTDPQLIGKNIQEVKK